MHATDGTPSPDQINRQTESTVQVLVTVSPHELLASFR